MAVENPRVESFTAGEDLPVDPAVIEREIASLWQEASEGDSGSVGRACHWNVVAYTRTGDDEQAAKGVVSEVSTRIPMRAIVVRAERDGSRPLRAWISANCHLGSGGDRLICSEEVTLAAGGEEIRHVPSLVTALVVPDLPSVLWWAGQGAVPGDEVGRLLDDVDRLILDPASTVDLEAAITLAVDRPHPCTVGALAWQRIRPWRMAIAETDRSLLAGGLDDADAIDVRHPPGRSVAGRLLAGWLVSRRRDAGSPGAIRIEEGPDGDGGTGVASVEVRTPRGAARLEASGGSIRIDGAGMGGRSRSVPIGDLGISSLLLRELRAVWDDGRLRRALRGSAGILS